VFVGNNVGVCRKQRRLILGYEQVTEDKEVDCWQ